MPIFAVSVHSRLDMVHILMASRSPLQRMVRGKLCNCMSIVLLFILIIYNTVPSGFPQDVSVDSATSQSVDISWSPPLLEERNGIITSYTVTVSRQGSDSPIQIASPTTSISVSMLNPFTSYTVTVAALTSIGVGPPSTLLTFRTAEDGKGACMCISKVINKLGIPGDGAMY